APFVIQVSSWCSLAANGSLPATNGSVELLLALAQVPLVCGDFGAPEGPRAVPCPGGGPLGVLGDNLAQVLNADPRWGQRLRQRQQLCRDLPAKVWPPRSAPPQLRIIPVRSGPAAAPLTLECHAWGFAPPDITLRWLRNGDIVRDTRGQPRVLPVGDGTFRTQVTIEVAPGTKDTFECSALHPSLEEPVTVKW
ncbi:DMB protein, partial [Drymodes brunneopygia]|nr:DMB protein [Drymodes brunneopygia]